MSALDKLHQRMTDKKTLLCVGLDSDITKLPNRFTEHPQPQLSFNQWIIDQTFEHLAAYKFNLAFYEAAGSQGWHELQKSVEYLRIHYPEIFLIADAKRGDIGNTNEAYAQALFDELGFDAVTLNPYLGGESLAPFLEREDKVSIILCRTSNPGAGEIQDLRIGEKPLWHLIAEKVKTTWNYNHNCMLVVGATYPHELKAVRELVGDELDFLVPGVGAQGGSLEEVLAAGLNKQQQGLLINLARSVIFSANPSEALSDVFKQATGILAS